MGGQARSETMSASEVTLSRSPSQATLLGNIPANACEGQMDFIKRTTGDTVYIGLRGKQPTSKNYDIILTDDIPEYTMDGLVLGDINALGSAATSIVSMLASFNTTKFC